MKKEKGNLISFIIDTLGLVDCAHPIAGIISIIALRGIFLYILWTMAIYLSTRVPPISIISISMILGVCYSYFEEHLKK